MFLRILVFVLVFASAQAQENSIILTMDRLEHVHNLQKRKYAHKQFDEIEDALSEQSERIRVVTYNMLFDIYEKKLAPENRWPARLPRIVELVYDMDPDVMGTQELLPHQVQDLLPFLAYTYSFYSIDSDSGEQNGIFYKKERFEVLEKDIFFMDPTDTTLTMLQLRDKKTDKSVAILNAHFAFSDLEKRIDQAHFVANKVASLAKDMPVIFMGDLNTFPNRPDEVFPFYDGDYVHDILTKKTLKDSISVSLVGHVGPIGTYTNNPPSIAPFEGTGTPGVFLDHIYVSKGVTVLIHAVQPGTVDGHFPSDHMPVLIDCVLK